MTELRNLKIEKIIGEASDAFARLRVSNPESVFDSKQIFDNAPLLFDDQETSGSGTSSTYDADKSQTRISVSATTAGTRVRQTFRGFNYQPGKSQLIMMTGVIGAGGTGLTQRIGYFQEDDGLFFQVDDGTFGVVRRTSTTGSPVDNVTTQASFNLDTLDGNGPSGVTIDLDKTQIFVIDFEWLGVGAIRFGIVVDNEIIYCHKSRNANVLTEVYMKTPNLPVRYEISNDGTGAAATVQHICSSVKSEGGENPKGIVRYHSNGSTKIDANAIGTKYLLVGIRFASGVNYTEIDLETISVLASTADNFEWQLIVNPTFGSAPSWSSLTNSPLETTVGNAGNPSSSTVTGGTVIAGGYGSGNTSFNITIPNSVEIGKNIAGTPDELVLVGIPITANLDLYGGISWREF